MVLSAIVRCKNAIEHSHKNFRLLFLFVRMIFFFYISNVVRVEIGNLCFCSRIKMKFRFIYRLGHSRASLFFHRLTIIGIFVGLILLFLVAIPFLILTAPCLLCCRYKQIRNRLKNLTKLGQRFQQQQYTPTQHPTPSSSLNQLNSSSLIDIEQESRAVRQSPLLTSSIISKSELSTVWYVH